MLRVCRPAIVLIFASLLAACGNKGPLVLPDKQAAAGRVLADGRADAAPASPSPRAER